MRRLHHGLVLSWLSLSLMVLSGCQEAETPAVVQSSLVSLGEPESSTDSTESVVAASNSEPLNSEVVLAANTESKSDGPKADEKKKASEEKPLFDGWNSPALVLVLSGEQRGYFEPCGCSEHQSGGMARRHDLVKQIQAKGWPVAGLDLGGTVNRSRPQSKLKFQTILAALKDMRYGVLNLGPEELKLGAADLLAAHSPDAKDPVGGVSFVSANVTLFGSPELGTPVRSKMLTLGKHKVGVTSVLGTSFRKEVTPEGASVDITIDDPATSLPPVIKELQAQQPDLLVLLAHGTLAEGKALAKQFPQFAVVMSSGGVEDPEVANPLKIDNTLFVQVGHKGKYTGAVGFFPQDAQNRLRFELIKLTEERFQDSPKMVEHMRLYQDLIKEAALAETEPAIKHPSGAKFVGTKVCGECHSKALAVWEKSDHAKAYDSLIKGRPELKDRWVSRIYDPECLACHTTGWHPQDVSRYVGGFESKAKTAHLLHNGCENCHGPGSRHIQFIEAGDKEAANKEVRLTLDEAKKTQCVTCHDLDNDPHFGTQSFDSYWEKIKHVGRD